jgi:hypothetical protein
MHCLVAGAFSASAGKATVNLLNLRQAGMLSRKTGKAGSGNTGVAAARNGRSFILVDENSNVIATMTNRLSD